MYDDENGKEALLRWYVAPAALSDEETKCPPSMMYAIKRRISAVLESEREDSLLGGMPEHVFTKQRRAVQKFRRRSRRLIRDQMGKLSEKYGAMHAWLFVPDSDSSLCARYAFRSRLRNQRVFLSKRSIVSVVYETGKAYVATDTRNDKNYLPRNPDTRSQISAAVIAFGPNRTRRILGILDMESNFPGTFTPEQAAELEIDVQELAVPLLALSVLEDDSIVHWPFEPRRDGWVVDNLLKRLCEGFITSIVGRNGSGDLSATIWHADWEMDRLVARATTDYDYEFRSKTLPVASFTGNTAKLDRNKVRLGSSDDPDFLEKKKARDMGLTRIVACPIYRPRTGINSLGALNVYQFHQMDPDLLPSDEVMCRFAEYLAEVITDFERTRMDAACVYLDQKMRVSELFADRNYLVPAQLHVLKDVFCECLNADGCSIFLPDDSEENLTLVCSTGVRDERIERHEGRWAVRRGEAATYQLKDGSQSGVLKYVYWHPGSAVRVNCREDLAILAKIKGPDFPNEALLNGMEHLTPDTTDRRFLGIGIRLYDGTRVVVRLVRSTQSQPFTKDDETLLEVMAELARKNDLWVKLPVEIPQTSEVLEHEVSSKEMISAAEPFIGSSTSIKPIVAGMRGWADEEVVSDYGQAVS